MTDPARDIMGREVSHMARSHRPRGLMGADPNVVGYLVSQGMSHTDANFVADYDPINKTSLLNMIASGTNPYDALTMLYGGAIYMPNLDNPPQPSYRPPSYAPDPGYPMRPAVLTTPPDAPLSRMTTVASFGDPAAPATPVTPIVPAATTAPLSIPASIFGIPTLYVAAGAAVAAFLLLRE